MFAWVSDVNNLPHYLPPIKSAELKDGGDRVWLKGEIPDQGEFENEGYFRVHEQERRMEWGAEVYRDYSGELSVSENGGGQSTVTVRLRFGPQTVEEDIQEQSDEDRDPFGRVGRPDAGIHKTADRRECRQGAAALAPGLEDY